jgi:predicted acetyltransferase
MLFEALREHDFNGQSCKLKLNITDTLIQENNRSWIVHFNGGRAAVKDEGEYESEVSMDIAGFSSLITGAVDFKTLLKYGIAGISEHGYAYTVHKLFEMPEKPVCLVRF